MGRHTRISQAFVAIAGIGVAAALAVPGVTAPTVKGDAAAWTELVTAYRKLNSLSGYRVKGDVSGGGRGGASFVYEVEPPDRAYHETRQTSRGTVELFSIGDKIVGRMPGRGRCRTLARDPNRIPLFRDLADPGDDFAYTITRQPDSVIDGTPTHAYGVTLDGARGGQSIPATIYIGAQTGLPRRVVTTVTVANQGTTRSRTTTLDFYDYGTKINVVLPNC